MYAVGEYLPGILARATEIVNRSMRFEFLANGLALMYACRGERLSSFIAWVKMRAGFLFSFMEGRFANTSSGIRKRREMPF